MSPPTLLTTYFPLFLAAQVPGIIPWYLLAAQALHESHFDPVANSSAGAWGVAQFMPDTWHEWGDGGDPTDPEDAIHAQARYMLFCWQELTKHSPDRLSWTWMIAAYTAGPALAARIDSFDDYSVGVQAHIRRVIQSAHAYKALQPEQE